MTKPDPIAPLTDEDGEVRELTSADFDRARRLDAMPAGLQGKLRGPQKAATKEQISLRVSRDVLERFRATGAGWQGRMDDALREWIERAG
jgi:uncharacterized protein (DUF4415 family)